MVRKKQAPVSRNHQAVARTHFFLTVNGMGQMMAEKSISSEANKAKHTERKLAQLA